MDGDGKFSGRIGGGISRDAMIDQNDPIRRRRFVCSWGKNY
jgi:hypothetical protein